MGLRSKSLRAAPPVRFSLTVNGAPLEVEAEAPPERARLDELLPALRALDNAVVDRAVESVEADGERVSCARGCAACCKRQPVPVSPPEALALSRLVDRMPEPRRSAVRAAFAAAVEQVKGAGIYETYTDRSPSLTREDALATVRRYMALGIHCPFLVDDACGIYEDRPFVCRQYLVTSPPELCENPLDNPVRQVPMPIRLATAVVETTETLNGRAQYTVPLVLALDHAARHRSELSRKHDARDALAEVVRQLSL